MTVRKAMTFGSSKVDDIEALIANDSMSLEQKYDGTRAMCVVLCDEDGVKTFQFLARNGQPLKHTAATQWIGGIERALRDAFFRKGETVLDGEIMIDSGAYIMFDLPYLERDGEVIVSPESPYSERRKRLESIARKAYAPVILGGMALTADEKRALFTSVMEQHGEGVMAKSLVSPYDEGKRVKHSLKVKFVKTADVVVMDVQRSRNDEGREIGSIQFGVYGECTDCVPHDDSDCTCVTCHGTGLTLDHLGRCSPIGKPICAPGDVIEVRYLYRQAGGSLVQPTMLQVREDREPKSCGYDQFNDYSKAVL